MTASVLIVDDSPVVRHALRRVLSTYPDIDVVGDAGDAYQARDMIVELEPDVITLDIEMPKMSGLTFLRKLMDSHPVPTIVLSSYTTTGSAIAVEALHAGAVDVLAKPGSGYLVEILAEELAKRIIAAAGSRSANDRALPSRTDQPPSEAHSRVEIIVVAASMGGTQAIRSLLASASADAPPILIVQHMPAQFTSAFASRLNDETALSVREATPRQRLQPGVCLVAPGDRHLTVERDSGNLTARLHSGPRVGGHRPSANLLFNSVAKVAGRNSTGVVLTGMGADGARGLAAIKDAGGITIAQDESTSVVYGMPGEAARTGAAHYVLTLDEIAAALFALSPVN